MRKSTLVVGFTLLLGSLSLAAGCSSGSTVGGGDGGLGDGGSSGTSGGTGDAAGGVCTEFHIGGQNDPGIGGAATSQVAAQAIADYAGAAQTQLEAVTAACKALATSLGASSADQAAAEGSATPDDKAYAWCQLAASTIASTKADAGGTISLVTTPPACRLEVAKKLACEGRCAGTAACDGTANPVICRGGTLSGGFCTGGKLEGGCKVDAKCDANCDVSVVAAADCPMSAVTVTPNGATNGAKAATLKSALEASLPSCSRSRRTSPWRPTTWGQSRATPPRSTI
jgi:hypothetical protein